MRIPHSGVAGGVLLFLAVVAPRPVGAEQPLVSAIRQHDRAAVQALLKTAIDVNSPEPDGQTALHWATYVDDLETAALLIRAGARVNASNDYGVTPLSLACTNRNAAMVRVLVEAGADPNAARVTGETPLMTCAATGTLDAVKVLLTHGANANAKAEWHEQTALMWAASGHHNDVLRALLAHGADIRARTLVRVRSRSDHRGGYTALLFAVREGNLEGVRLLLEAGADVNDTAADGASALLVAAVRAHLDVLQLLLEWGADPDANRKGYTALHWVTGATSWMGDWLAEGAENGRDPEWRWMSGPANPEAFVTALLAHGADINARLTTAPERYGSYAQVPFESTPLMLATVACNLKLMRLLLANGADPHLGAALFNPETNRMRMGNINLLMAATGVHRGNLETVSHISEPQRLAAVQLVLDLGVDVNTTTSTGDTALHGAARSGADAVIQLLVERGANVNAKNTYGVTPLNHATRFGYIKGKESTRTLLQSLGGELSTDCVYTNDNTVCGPAAQPSSGRQQP